ncbi:MAG: hypothetical protein WAL89_07215 [Candidatus Sulfotelmatobacter sp.]|jgi:hypothetical protein
MKFVLKFGLKMLAIKMLALWMAWVVVSPTLASAQQDTSTPSGQQSQPKPPAEPSTEAILYKNTQYGFSFSLPKSWKGYKIVSDKWEGSDTARGDVERGPFIYIRHPDWTKENPRQDIPIMVFTLAQWESVAQGNFLINAATFVPNELGRNRKYVFALPPRSNYADSAGMDEVDEILRHGPLHPFWSK